MQIDVGQQRPVFRLVYLSQENTCSQMYVDPNSVKNLAAKFFMFGNKLSDNDL